MARNIIRVAMRIVNQGSAEELKLLLALMETGECIGERDLGGKHYQLWDSVTSQNSKRPSDLIVGVRIDDWEYSYFLVKRSSLIQ